MFYHGIKVEYVYKDFPILSSRRNVSNKSKQQLLDRKHLLEQFGLEPIHLLEAQGDYPKERCLEECFAFGDVVFEFPSLDEPMWQLSQHEIGVAILPLQKAAAIYLRHEQPGMKNLFPNTPMYCVNSI